MIIKGRKRIMRGVLNDFKELPEKHKKNLCLIKTIIQDFLNCDKEIFIYGSFYHGNWDEKSDYDVLVKFYKINNPKKIHFDFLHLKKIIKEQYNLNVDIFIVNKNMGVLIP